MVVDKRYKVEKVVSKDPVRYSLNRPYFDAKAKALVATEGHAIVVVPAEPSSPEEASGFVDVLDLQTARKRAKPVQANTVEVAVIPNTPIEDRFPDYAQVMPAFAPGDEGTLTVQFDLRFLRAICDGLGTDGHVVRLTVKCDPEKPTFADSGPIAVADGSLGADPKARAALMPIRR